MCRLRKKCWKWSSFWWKKSARCLALQANKTPGRQELP
jgi:hypothetical protein